MPSKPMINRAKNGPYDELWTPKEALKPLLPYVQHMKNSVGWDCAYGSGQLASLMRDEGFLMMGDPDHDFLAHPVDFAFDWIITNPPYSKKIKFLAKAEELGMPWAMLLPVTTLGVKGCQKYLKQDSQILFLKKRVDFTGRGAPWFAVAWFTKRLNLAGGQLLFP